MLLGARIVTAVVVGSGVLFGAAGNTDVRSRARRDSREKRTDEKFGNTDVKTTTDSLPAEARNDHAPRAGDYTGSSSYLEKTYEACPAPFNGRQKQHASY